LRDKTNAKIIVVYFGGRPRLLGDIVETADAILLAFLPGPDAGKAVVEIITGEQNPTGRLPITYPKYQDGGGIPYWHTVSDQCTASNNPHEPLPHWIYTQCEVQWPFGFGLSYTSFKYSNLRVESSTIWHHVPWSGHGIKNDKDKNNSNKVFIDVQNTGSRQSFETIMLFLFVEHRIVTPEYKQLMSFKRRKLDPGQTITQQFELTTDQLKFVGPHDDRHDILQIGQTFRLGVGSTTDCRKPDANELCTEPLTVQLNSNLVYEPSCEAACILLESHECLAAHKLSGFDCYSMCLSSYSPTNTMEKGWGWNYLNCIESILLDKRRTDERKCYDVDTLCRGVLLVNGTSVGNEEGSSIMDQSRSRPPPGEYNVYAAKQNIQTVLVSIFAGIIGTLIVIHPFYRNASGRIIKRKGDKPKIVFSPLSRNENGLELEII